MLAMRMFRRLLAGALCAAALPAAAADAAGGYSEALAQVYGAHQRLLAIKDACDEALPAQRAAHDKAYAGWRARHGRLVDDLDRRFAAMIRAASANEAEYARNIGKYEGAMLQQREEGKRAFLAQPRAEVERLCRQLPGTLAGEGTDFEKAYADELRVIRRRP
jgi:hypothetical protein